MDAAENIMTFPEIKRHKPETAEPFLRGWTEGEPDDADWLKDLRRRGMEAVAAQGLPPSALERWKYTNLLPAVKGLSGPLGGSDVSYTDPDGLVTKFSDAYKSAPDWLVELQNEPAAGEEQYHDMALWHMCHAYNRDGLLIVAPEGHKAKQPIEITITGHGGTFFVPRTAFRLYEGSELTIVEYHEGQGHYWNNRLTQIIVESGATLRHIRVQDNAPEAVYTQNTCIRVEAGGSYEAFVLTTGSLLSRNQVHVDLKGEGASCRLHGVTKLKGKQLGDTTATVVHHVPDCTSEQIFRTVLDERARGVVQSKAHVRKGAQGTDARQMSKALLLSEGAEMDAKPELEIYADAVQCAHGATTGALDQEALFYLRSRGLPEEEARRFLIDAFVREVTEPWDFMRLGGNIYARIEEKLAAY